MPTNVTADYKKAEQAFREAREPTDRLQCLKEMLRTIPKHKGTEHLQRDIKTRIKLLTDELSGPRKGGARTGPSYSVRPEGPVQIALLGPPNSGKSQLHHTLTGARTDIGPYPFTTQLPIPGMMPFEDVYIQLVDLPPISQDYFEPWIVNALQPADAALLVVDITNPECIDHIQQAVGQLKGRKINLTNQFEEDSSKIISQQDDFADPFQIQLPTILVANKIDLANSPDELDALNDLVNNNFPSIAVSAMTGENLDLLPRMIFDKMNIVRVYTKIPGKPADTDRPFTIISGGTVSDVARQIHKDFAETFRFARIWGQHVFDGQQVGPDHVLHDLDVVELHVK